MNKKLLLIGLAVIAIVATVLLVLGSQDNPTKPAQHLSARLSTLSRLLVEGSTSAGNSELRIVTSDASILISGSQTSVQRAMSAAGIKPPNKDIIISEADAVSFAELKEAKLNGRFDTTYQKILATKLDSTAALVKEVQSLTSNAQLDTALETTLSHIDVLQTRLAEL